MARLGKVVKDLNIGKQRAVDFLEKKGCPIDDDINAKLTDEQYTLLLKEFSSDKVLKEQTEKRQAERQVSKERKEEEKKKAAPKKVETIETVVPEESKPRFTPIGKIDLDALTGRRKADKTPAKETPSDAALKEVPSKEEKQQEAVAPQVTEEVSTPAAETETEVSAPEKEAEQMVSPAEQETSPEETPEQETTSSPEDTEEVSDEQAESEEKKAEEIFEFDHPELRVKPTVLGKMDLSAINQSTRPKKKTKEEKKKEREEKEKERQEQRKQLKESILKDIHGSTASGEKKKRNRIGAERVDINKAGASIGSASQGESRSEQRGNGKDRRGKGNDRDRARRLFDKNEINDEDVSKQVRDTLARLTNKQKSSSAKYRKEKREQAVTRQQQIESAELAESKVLKLTEFVTANELANMMNINVAQVISTCMSVGIMVSINQRLDAETINLVASEFGFTTEYVSADVAQAVTEEADKEEDLQPRAPIVTVMGHVDHGKTSLLDYIRKSNVIAGEAGGITQHIGAYNVKLEDCRRITFLDTPGHEAFTAMRARGAQATDVAIIIVAADDDVMPQTREAISHAQAANVPMVFAINKIDKPHADPERVKRSLAEMNLLVEDWGGKYQSQDISAKQGIGVHELMEKVLLEAEMLDLKANPNRKATGTVIESTLDKGRGYVATLLVSNGTLHIGDIVLAGTHFGRVKAMFNERNQRIKQAGPSEPVLILGLNGAPTAGDTFHVIDTDQEAREIANRREQLQREQGLRTQKMLTLDEVGRRIALGDFQQLNIIVKGDVDGSIEALSDSLIKLSTEHIQVNVIHKAVGQISESDVSLAAASQAIIVGFQVRPSQGAKKLADAEGVDIRLYSIIYDAIEEVKAAMEGMLAPTVKEEVTATVEVREVFHISKVGYVAGAMVREGKVKRSDKARLIRDGIVIYTGEINALKRFKDDVKEVGTNFECGISLVNCNDIKVGDLIETFTQIEVKQTL